MKRTQFFFLSINTVFLWELNGKDRDEHIENGYETDKFEENGTLWLQYFSVLINKESSSVCYFVISMFPSFESL